MSLEDQIKSLQEQIDLLKSGGVVSSPKARLQAIRRDYREKYFGRFKDVQDGNVSYGPENKTFSDYESIRDIIVKTTDFLFKYSKGTRAGTNILTLLKSEDDFKQYENVCDMVCKDLKEKIV